jgi:hypothetical protein
MNAEKIKDVFSTFHDGEIAGWEGDKTCLRLKIECEYLAELINPVFNHFHLEITEVQQLIFIPWMNPIELTQEYFVELKDMFQANLEILSAEIANDLVKIYCNQHDTSFDYCGGTLCLNCNDISIFDQRGKEMTIDQLAAISNSYWNKNSNDPNRA